MHYVDMFFRPCFVFFDCWKFSKLIQQFKIGYNLEDKEYQL